jgi:nitrogen regulatory protein PII
MKLLWIVADAAHLAEFQRTLHLVGAPGWTVSPVIEGAGRTGVHSADRVHPGALVSLLCVAEDSDAIRLFDAVVAARQELGDAVTRLFLLPVERQA